MSLRGSVSFCRTSTQHCLASLIQSVLLRGRCSQARVVTLITPAAQASRCLDHRGHVIRGRDDGGGVASLDSD